MMHVRWRFALWCRGTFRERFRRCPLCRRVFAYGGDAERTVFSLHRRRCRMRIVRERRPYFSSFSSPTLSPWRSVQ